MNMLLMILPAHGIAGEVSAGLGGEDVGDPKDGEGIVLNSKSFLILIAIALSFCCCNQKAPDSDNKKNIVAAETANTEAKK